MQELTKMAASNKTNYTQNTFFQNLKKLNVNKSLQQPNEFHMSTTKTRKI